MAEIPANSCEVCAQPTTHRCKACKLAFYCSLEHQQEHWQEHKSQCKPYKICRSCDLGLYLEASRDLKPGDLIVSEYPLVFGPKHHTYEDGPVPCVGCCRLIDAKFFCPECSWPACSTQCGGLNNNSRHGLECRILKLQPPKKPFRFDILAVLRALFLQKNSKTKWQKLLELEAHVEKRGPETDIFKIVDEKVRYLRENFLAPFELFDDVSNEILHKIYGIFDVTAWELTEEVEASILYPVSGLIEHNCTPNICQSIDDSYKMTIRACLPIEKHAHIKSTYTNILWGTYARREDLKSTKYLECTCLRCNDPTEFGTCFSALKCMGLGNEPCGGTQLPENPTGETVQWSCDKCKLKLPNDEIMKFVEHLGVEVEKILAKTASVPELEELLGKLLKFLHPNHYLIYSVKHTLVQMYNSKFSEGVELSDNFLFEKIEMCEDLIKITRTLDPGYSRLGLYLGVLLHELFEAKFTVLLRNPGNEDRNVEEIAQIIKENKKVLEFESQSKAGSKLLGVIFSDEAKFEKWLKKL